MAMWSGIVAQRQFVPFMAKLTAVTKRRLAAIVAI